MPEQPNSFEAILEQIANLLKFAQDNKAQLFAPKEDQKPFDPQIEKQLQDVEKTIEIFTKITDKALITSGLDESTIQSNVQAIPETFEAKDRRLLQKAKKLRGELEVMEKEFASWHTIAKMRKKIEKTEGKKRVKKFKRLGGQGWTPL